MSDRRKVVVPGASSGIGKATAIRFAADGYDVCLNARREKLLEEVAAGLEPGPSMHGHGLAADGPGHEFIFAEAGRNQTMARSRTRKLIANGPRLPSLLFDLEKDPLEMKNVYGAQAYRGDVQKLEAALAAWRPKDTPMKRHLDYADPPQVAWK